MSETPQKKLASPQERLELVLLCLARQVPVKQLCREAGISRELCYRWLRAVREASLKALEFKKTGPKRLKADPSPLEVLKLQDRVKRLEKELAKARKERDRWQLMSEVARRIIRRNAWGPIPKAGSKKNGMRSQKRGRSICVSGPLSEPAASVPRYSPSAGESPGAPTGAGPLGSSGERESAG